jgi:hypothetical protein
VVNNESLFFELKQTAQTAVRLVAASRPYAAAVRRTLVQPA